MMEQGISFRLFSLGNDAAQGLLVPEGCLVIQALGFPRDTATHTCIPTRGVGYWSRAGVTQLDHQWYKPLEPIPVDALKMADRGTHRFGSYLCHARRPDTRLYPISTLSVDGELVQRLEFQKQVLVFQRLGHRVELDLSAVPADQRFTLAAEWSPVHLELRATWMQGEGLEEYYSGEGVPYEQFGSYQPPNKGEAQLLSARAEFPFAVIPSALAWRLWNALASQARANDATPAAHAKVETLRRAYRDSADMKATFLLIVSEVNRILDRIEPTAFWNDRSPKPEPDAAWALRALLEALCPLKNLRIYQEDASRSGRVDVVFSAISQDHTHLELVMELKHAHSERLFQGLTDQLPQYVAERRPDAAVYGVFWYKGQGCDKPAYPTLAACLGDLDARRPREVAAVCGFDVSYRTPASKVERGAA